MKFISILLVLLTTLDIHAALPPTRAAGLDQTLGVGFNLRTYGSGITDLGGINKLFEGKAEPLLLNPSFETLLGTDSWTYTPSGADTAVVENGTVIEGLNSLLLSPAAETFTFDQTISIDQYDGKVVGFSCEINSTETGNIQACFMEGTTELDCYPKSNQNIPTADKWNKYEVLGSVISGNTYGIRVKSDVAITDNVYIDKCEFTSNPLNFKDGYIEETIVYDGFQALSLARIQLRNEIQNTSSQLISVDNTTHTRVTALRDCVITATVAGRRAAGGHRARVEVYNSSNVLLYVSNQNQGTANNFASATGSFKLSAGDYVLFGDDDLLVDEQATSFSVTARAKNPQIIENADIVSSENISFNFKSTAIDCDVDPIGTYNTYSKAASTNSFSICATAPTTLPNNNDGLFITSRAYNSASNCTTNIGRYEVCVGKSLKGMKVFGYQGTNKSGGQLDTDYDSATTSLTRGLLNTYSESNGEIVLDAQLNYNGGTTSRSFYNGSASPPVSTTTGYFHFALSKNPIVNAIDAVPRVDYSWENDFVAKVDGDATCAVLSENVNFIQSCSRSAAGAYAVTFVAGFFSEVPAVTVESSSNSDNNDVEVPYNVTTLGFDVRTRGNSGTNADSDFIITASRLGSDYRSRGDAAAIIAQPSCFLKEQKDNGSAVGTGSGTYAARLFATTLEGDCSFLTKGTETANGSFRGDAFYSDFSLDKGSYIVSCSAPAFKVNSFQTRLYNTTDSVSLLQGTSEYAQVSTDTVNKSFVTGRIDLISTTDLELQMIVQSSSGSNDLGVATAPAGGDELYSQCEITKIK